MQLARLQAGTNNPTQNNYNDDLSKYQFEMSYAKLRYEMIKDRGEPLADGEEVDMTQEEKEKAEEIEAKERQYFGSEDKVYDYRKKWVTDMDSNTHVTLPKALNPLEEATIELRRGIHLRVVKEFIGEECDEKENQAQNHEADEARGLKKLLRRIKEHELVIMKPDKSNKFAVTTMNKYKEFGSKHFGKDKEIDEDDMAVANGISDPHEVISSEDNLYRIHKATRESAEWRDANLRRVKISHIWVNVPRTGICSKSCLDFGVKCHIRALLNFIRNFLSTFMRQIHMSQTLDFFFKLVFDPKKSVFRASFLAII